MVMHFMQRYAILVNYMLRAEDFAAPELQSGQFLARKRREKRFVPGNQATVGSQTCKFQGRGGTAGQSPT